MGIFRLQEALPDGPQARVFRAEHHDNANTYALKIFDQRIARIFWQPSSLSEELKAATPEPKYTTFKDSLATLVEELSVLDSPHLPKLLPQTSWQRSDLMGEHGLNIQENEGLSCLAMEYFEGGSLHSLISTFSGTFEPIDLALAVDIIRQAALGVAHVYKENGRLHCNLKPSNLLLTADESDSAKLGYRVAVSDFSIIPPLHWNPEYLRWVSTETWIYSLPPEYFSLSNPTLDERADVFALGAILYTAINGRPPFALPPRRGRDWEPFDTNFYQAMLLNYSDTNPLPALTFQPNVTKDLQSIIQTCLEKEPGKRYTSADELADVLQDELQDLLRTKPQPLVSNKQGIPITNPQVRVFFNRGIVANEQLPLHTVADEPYSEHVLNGDGLIIGSAKNGQLKNDIVLPGIAAQQLKIDWNAIAVSVTNLPTTNEALSDKSAAVRVDEMPLAPGSCEIWRWEQSIEVGSYLLRLVKPADLTEMVAALPSSTPFLPLKQAQGRPPDWIKLETPAEPIQVTPGREVSFPLTITFGEQFTRVENLEIAVQEPAFRAWFLNLPTEKRFSEADSKGDNRSIQFTMRVYAPIVPESRAGKHIATIRATSKDGEFKEGAITLDVQRFTESSIIVRPSRYPGALRARYTIYLRNKGNAPERYQITCEDEPQLLRCDTSAPELDVLPGQTRQVALVAQPCTWIWLAQPERHEIIVTALTNTRAEPQRAITSFEQRALIPRWALMLLLLLLLLPCIIIYFVPISISPAADQTLKRGPFYGILTPPTFTATPTITPSIMPSPTSTPTPTTTSTPTVNGTLVAILIATSTPTATSTLPPSPTSTLQPTNTALAQINGVILCPARGSAYTIQGSGAIVGTEIGLWIEWRDGHSEARKVDGGDNGKPFTVHADGTYGIDIMFTNADGPGLYQASIREINAQGTPGSILTTFSCQLPKLDETLIPVQATTTSTTIPTPTNVPTTPESTITPRPPNTQ